LEFKASKCDPSLFIYSKNSQVVYLLVYVDDIIITGSSTSLVQQLVNQLNSIFSLKQLGDLDYLGIEVKHLEDGSLLLTQSKYIKDLAKTNMFDCNPITTPMMSSCKLSKVGSDTVADATLYRYLKGTAHLGLKLIPTKIHHPLSLTAYCAADWVSDPDDRRSTSGAANYAVALQI
ncbi:retrovirus-related pol polyprotein from transposon TNT 1-94, partial [Trifolium medium]|nr:retrovirus-related pol polyprotein from transposon TNT 1-94 [Trifolium medium]